MKAYQLEETALVESRPLEMIERMEPVPEEGEILVRVNACGICRTDLHVVEGDLPVRRNRVIPGHQIVGEVESFGPGTEGMVVGDRVGC